MPNPPFLIMMMMMMMTNCTTVTAQSTVKTHQSYQHNTTVHLCCVRQYGNELALTALTIVAPICKMLKLRRHLKMQTEQIRNSARL